MPILDLLASITGEKPSPESRPSPVPQSGLTAPKRKAEDEARTTGTKAARIESTAERSSRPNTQAPKLSPRPPDRAPGSSASKPSAQPRPVSQKTAIENCRPTDVKASGSGAAPSNGNTSLPSRPLSKGASAADSAPPKKRSYAEIMARAKANSELRESLGKIQHKTVERTMTMKERKELKAEEARKARLAARRTPSGRPSALSTSLRVAAKPSGARNGVPSGPANNKSAAVAEGKKVKKAALATTGYTGTARPPPGASANAKASMTSRPSTESRPRDRPRYGGSFSSSRKRYEEEDDMDDFIEYDEEEEEPGHGSGRRYRYDSYDDESDMEAGLSDIEDEEQEADRHARREDLEQEALEKRLKREKEERKRKMLDAVKAKASSR